MIPTILQPFGTITVSHDFMSDIMSHIFANDLTLYRFNYRKIFWFDQWLVSSATHLKLHSKKPQKSPYICTVWT